jgi:hypothetical protein
MAGAETDAAGACRWVATRGVEPGAVLEALGLVAASRAGGDLHFEGATVAGAVLNGWFLVAFGPDDAAKFEPAIFKRLSRRGEMLAVSADASGTETSCDYWFAGGHVWRVAHDGRIGASNLAVTGEGHPPTLSYFRSVANKPGQLAMADVPLRLAFDETGFHQARALPAGVLLGRAAPPAEAEAILAALPPPKPFWKFW